jgi:F-box protein 21
MAFLTDLPAELLEAIFIHLNPRSLFEVSLTNKSFHKVTTDAPVIWRHFCLTRFKWWSPDHQIAAKAAAPLSSVEWRSLFIYRVKVKQNTRRLLNEALETQQRRIHRINEVATFGYDAKETLLQEMACPDDAEDVLARRYYANAMLQRIQREMAITVWKELSDGKAVSLEKALAAYDMFTRTGDHVDFDVITSDLDDLAKHVQVEYPHFHELNTRRKASTLSAYLRDKGFEGVGDTSYRALRNSFIGLVLRSAGHQSLPLISVAIYCALASRLGLDARPCGFLFHVYCLVYAPKDYDLDGNYKPTSSNDLEYMYLDPFRSSDEVDQRNLLQTLRDMGIPSVEHDRFLRDTTTREMTLRTGRNIMNSVQTIRQAEANNPQFASWLNATPDMDNAFYAAIWAFLMLSPQNDTDPAGGLHSVHTRRRQYLPYLLDHFQSHYPWDIALLEEHVIPLFQHQPERDRLLEFVQAMNNMDVMHRPVTRRTPKEADKVAFKVGQLFVHKRYEYEGVITGWDPACEAGEEWIQSMGVDQLSGGRNQSFYHVL